MITVNVNDNLMIALPKHNLHYKVESVSGSNIYVMQHFPDNDNATGDAVGRKTRLTMSELEGYAKKGQLFINASQISV